MTEYDEDLPDDVMELLKQMGEDLYLKRLKEKATEALQIPDPIQQLRNLKKQNLASGSGASESTLHENICCYGSNLPTNSSISPSLVSTKVSPKGRVKLIAMETTMMTTNSTTASSCALMGDLKCPGSDNNRIARSKPTPKKELKTPTTNHYQEQQRHRNILTPSSDPFQESPDEDSEKEEEDEINKKEFSPSVSFAMSTPVATGNVRRTLLDEQIDQEIKELKSFFQAHREEMMFLIKENSADLSLRPSRKIRPPPSSRVLSLSLPHHNQNRNISEEKRKNPLGAGSEDSDLSVVDNVTSDIRRRKFKFRKSKEKFSSSTKEDERQQIGDNNSNSSVFPIMTVATTTTTGSSSLITTASTTASSTQQGEDNNCTFETLQGNELEEDHWNEDFDFSSTTETQRRRPYYYDISFKTPPHDNDFLMNPNIKSSSVEQLLTKDLLLLQDEPFVIVQCGGEGHIDKEDHKDNNIWSSSSSSSLAAVAAALEKAGLEAAQFEDARQRATEEMTELLKSLDLASKMAIKIKERSEEMLAIVNSSEVSEAETSHCP